MYFKNFILRFSSYNYIMDRVIFLETIRDWNKLLDFVRPAPGVHIVRIKGHRGANTAKMSGGGGEGW